MAKELVFKLKIVDESGNVIEKAINNIEDLKKAQQDLSKALEKAPIGTERFNELKKNLGEVEKAQGKALVAQKGFVGALKEIPGPIGSVAQGVSGLGKSFKLLIANPVGATLAAIVGALVLMKNALASTEEGTKKLSGISDGFTRILNGVFAAIEPVANMLADMFTELLANEKAMQGLSVAVGVLTAIMTTAIGVGTKLYKFIFTQLIISFNTLKDIAEGTGKVLAGVFTLDLDLIKEGAAQAKDAYIKSLKDTVENVKTTAVGIGEAVVTGIVDGFKQGQKGFEEGTQRLTQGQKDELDEAQKLRDEAAKKRLEAERDAAKALQQLQDENTLEAIADERERSEKAVEIAKQRALEEIKLLDVSDKTKAKLNQEEETKAQLALKAIADDFAQRKKDKEEEDARALADLKAEIADAEANTEAERRALEIQKVKDHYAALIAEAEKNGKDTTQLVKSRGEVINELNEQFRQEDLAKEVAVAQAKADIQMASIQAVAQAGKLLSAIAGENKKLAITGLRIEMAASIAGIISNTALANAKSVAAFPLTAGLPFVAINTISAGLAIATTIAETNNAIAEINSESEAESSSTPPIPATKFAKGGLLRGPSHAQGGILTPFGELEGGEFITNKFATQAFLPMLEEINRMGQSGTEPQGGISQMPSPIIKTYVVASEMGTELEKRKKLQDLARL